MKILIGVAAAGAALLSIIRAGRLSAQAIHDVGELESGRLRAKVEAYEMLHGDA